MASSDFEQGGGGLTVTGSATLALEDLLPGDRSATHVVELRAVESLDYEVRVEWDGSAVLAAELDVTLTDANGNVFYSGPLRDASVANAGTLASGQTRTIAIEALLPLTAGNEVQGQELAIQLVVEATGA